MNLFENASRRRYRFNFKGLIGVEELWTLSLDELNTIWQGLNNHLKKKQEDSLLDTVSKVDKEIQEKADIVKYIFEVKKEEQDKAAKRAERHAERQKLLAIKYEKENEALKNSSIEEINAKLAALDAEESEE